MSELFLFTLNAIVIYLVSDRLVRMIERRRGGVMKQRQVIFFVIFLTLALVSFRLMQMLLGKPRIEGREMAAEPIGQALLQHPAAGVGVFDVSVHQVVDLVEQVFVLLLVRGVFGIARLAHVALLQREMRRNSGMDVLEAGFDVGGVRRALDVSVNLVDQTDQLAMLVVHRRDPERIGRCPLQ
jgi:hypothetical protein